MTTIMLFFYWQGAGEVGGVAGGFGYRPLMMQGMGS